jgi:hypothetical protein
VGSHDDLRRFDEKGSPAGETYASSVAVEDGRPTFRLGGQAFDKVLGAIKRAILDAELGKRLAFTGIDR